MRPKFTNFNDGVLFVCRPDSGQSDFNAVKNPTTKTDLDVIWKLDFREMSRRDRDMDFAESQGRTLALKVKTHLLDGVNRMHMVTIGNTLYSIINLDKDRANREMYFYLEEVRDLA